MAVYTIYKYHSETFKTFSFVSAQRKTESKFIFCQLCIKQICMIVYMYMLLGLNTKKKMAQRTENTAECFNNYRHLYTLCRLQPNQWHWHLRHLQCTEKTVAPHRACTLYTMHDDATIQCSAAILSRFPQFRSDKTCKQLCTLANSVNNGAHRTFQRRFNDVSSSRKPVASIQLDNDIFLLRQIIICFARTCSFRLLLCHACRKPAKCRCSLFLSDSDDLDAFMFCACVDPCYRFNQFSSSHFVSDRHNKL